MVLETWATDFGDCQQMFITQDNPVQRRPKIDYFSNEAVQSMIPIVSHISSNGYYGYCATPATPPAIEDDKAPMDIQMDVQTVLQPPNGHANQATLPESVERRKRCQNFVHEHDDQVIATKRCRNQAIDAEIGEDRSICADNAFPVTASTDRMLFSASSTAPIDATRYEAATKCIETTTMVPASMKTVPHGHTDSEDVASITDNINFMNCAVDMERLFWHTHGSVLWHCGNR